MATSTVTTDPETKEINYLKLQLLLVKEGTGILKALFDHIVPPNQLQATLKQFEPKLKIEQKKNVILRGNFSKLYPQSQNTVPDSSEFDISLLVYLLRSICRLNKKSQWWDEKDNNNIQDTVHDEEADVTRIRNVRNEMQHRNVASLEKAEFDSMWDVLEKVMLRFASKCGIQDQQQRIDLIKKKKLDVVSQDMISLRKNTKIFLGDFNDKSHYVETRLYTKAKEILQDKKILVLTGHPGEGKTTMAARLALSSSEMRNCVCLSQASDWRILDLEQKLTDTVIIDDIFGDGALDQKLVSGWKQILPEIERAAKKGYIRVIITSRNYIFKEANEEMSVLPGMFRKKNGSVLLLTSSELTVDERYDILNVLARKNNIDISENKVNDCVKAARESRHQTDSENFVFGFPECASMFVRNDEMFKSGADFFENPASLFIEYLEELYRGGGIDKFMALVSVWVKENKRLSLDELKSIETVSEPVKRMVDAYGIELNNNFLKLVTNGLETHKGDFVIFNENTDEYMFSHNIISDMVGIVIGRKKLEETVEVCPRDFLMERVTVNEEEKDNDYKVFVKKRKFESLARKFTNMILRRNCNTLSRNVDIADFEMFQRRGKRGNVVKVDNSIDFGIIKHKAFRSSEFVNVFLDYISREKLVKEVFSVPVMNMNGYFLDYGISMPKLDMCLSGYAWLSRSSVFAQEVTTRKEVKEIENLDPTFSLLLAIHSNEKKSIQFLLENGAKVTGDAIYIAAHRNVEHLEMLLNRQDVDVNDRGNAINGNYPLIIAARKGQKDAVLCMLKFRCDPGVQNTAKMTALHKAILYKHSSIITSLIEAGAPLDIRGGKFKRTPLHIAADTGNINLAKKLVSKGASLKIKDYRGQYPIHIAAIRDKVDIVKYLFSHDRSQETLRISSYGTKSMIKGMSLFHIAIWKKNANLLEALIHMEVNPNIQDFYGRTPLFCGIMEGNVKLVKRMIAYAKTDKTKPQKQGYTPLHAAIHKGLNTVAKQLIHHTDVNTQDRYGKTPLHVACEKVNIIMIKSLLGSGADPRMVSKRGDTVFHLLKRRRNLVNNETLKRSKKAQILLAEWDPEFFRQLPGLKNKAGTIIKIHYVPTGSLSRENLLQQPPRFIKKNNKPRSFSEIETNDKNVANDDDDDNADDNEAEDVITDYDDADDDENDDNDDDEDNDDDDEEINDEFDGIYYEDHDNNDDYLIDLGVDSSDSNSDYDQYGDDDFL